MAGPPRLRPEDRADFEEVLHLALSTADIRTALLADPSGDTTGRVRARALDDTDEILAQAEREYAAYVALRASAQPGPQQPSSHGTVLPALTVLTPVVAATSAVILLLLGYVLRIAAVPGTLPASVVTAGWVLALIAAVSTLLALTALTRAAVRQHGGPPTADDVEQARLAWQQALLDRGMLPHLRGYIREDPVLRAAPPSPPPSGTPPADPDGTSHHIH